MAAEWPQVLVVDDEPEMCWALEKALHHAGYDVTTATNGKDALKLIAGSRYSVVFLDAKLPDVEGIELAAIIKERYPRTSVVMISGYYYQDDNAISSGVEEGLFMGFLPKPFSTNGLRSMARLAVARSASWS